MPSNQGHAAYDENLLAAAPAATKAQLQSGYTTDLLDSKANAQHVPSSRRRDDLESGQAYADKTGTSSSPSHTPIAAPVPFYRTKKGRILLAIGALIVLAAIIGGAVGGTVGNKKSKNLNSPPTSSAAHSSTETGQGGAAPTASASQGGGLPTGLGSATGAATSTVGPSGVQGGTPVASTPVPGLPGLPSLAPPTQTEAPGEDLGLTQHAGQLR